MAQLILIAGRNTNNKPTIWQFNPGTETFSVFHEHSNTNAEGTTEGFKDLHIKDGNNIAAVGTFSGASPSHAWISYLRDGSWYDWVYDTNHNFNSVVIRPNGKLWITGETASFDGLLEFDPDDGPSLTGIVTGYSGGFQGIKQRDADGDLVVMDHGSATSGLRNPFVYNGSWVNWGNPGGRGHDGWSGLDYFDGSLYAVNYWNGRFYRASTPGSWSLWSGPSARPSYYRFISLKMFATNDIYLVEADNSIGNFRLVHWNGSSWTTKGSWGAYYGGAQGYCRLRFTKSTAAAGRCYVHHKVNASTNVLRWTDNITSGSPTWSSATMASNTGTSGLIEVLDTTPATPWLIGGRDDLGFLASHSEIKKYYGGAFTQEYLSPNAVDSFVADFFNQRKHIYAVGSHDRYDDSDHHEDWRIFLHSEDDGDTWSGEDASDSRIQIKTGIVRDDGSIWVGARVWEDSMIKSGVYERTAENTYVQVHGTGNSVPKFLHLADDDIWIGAGNAVWWNGVGWYTRGKPSTDDCEFLLGDDSDIVFIGNKTIATHDTGTLWDTPLWSTATSDYKFYCGTYVDINTFYLGGSYQGYPTVWKWNGATLDVVWQNVTGSDLAYGVADLKRSTRDGSIIAVARQEASPNAVLLESFDGINWTEQAFPDDFEGLSVFPIDYIPDTVAPVVTAVDPTSGELDVDPFAEVTFTVTDNADELDPDTVKIWVNGILTWQNDAWTTQHIVEKTSVGNGLQYVVHPQPTGWIAESSPSIRVYAEDYDENSVDTTYNFTVAAEAILVDEDFGSPTTYPINTGNGDLDQTGLGHLELTADFGDDMSPGSASALVIDVNNVPALASWEAAWTVDTHTTTNPFITDVVTGAVVSPPPGTSQVNDGIFIHVGSADGAPGDVVVNVVSGGVPTAVSTNSNTAPVGSTPPEYKITILPQPDGTSKAVPYIKPDPDITDLWEPIIPLGGWDDPADPGFDLPFIPDAIENKLEGPIGGGETQTAEISFFYITGEIGDLQPPYIDNEDPAPDATEVEINSTVQFDILDSQPVSGFVSGLNESSITIDVDGSPAWASDAQLSGFAVSTSPLTSGIRFTVDPNTDFRGSRLVVVEVYAEDNEVPPNVLDTSWSFTTAASEITDQWDQGQYSDSQYGIDSDPEEAAPNSSFTAQQVNVVEADAVIGFPTVRTAFNQFDEHGLVLGLPRLRGEYNWEYRRRLHDTLVNRANSTYRGLIHGVTRELGLALYYPATIVPSVEAVDPYIKVEGVYMYLYSNYAGGILDAQIDRFEPGDNFEHLNKLAIYINDNTAFEMTVHADVDPFDRSMVLLNQSDRELVKDEAVSPSTKFKLKHPYVSTGTVTFSDLKVFYRKRDTAAQVVNAGDYHLDYTTGMVTVFTVPPLETTVTYQYRVHPFKPIASPVILYDINSDSFKVKMFNQLLQADGSLEHGLPTELGVDIINELMSVTPMYWGV